MVLLMFLSFAVILLFVLVLLVFVCRLVFVARYIAVLDIVVDVCCRFLLLVGGCELFVVCR